MNAETGSTTRLHGRWLLIARLAWTAAFFTLIAMYAIGFVEVRDVLSTVCEEEPCTLYVQIHHTEAGEQIMDWGGPPIGFADPLRPDQVEALEKLGLTIHQYGWLGALQMGIPALVYLLIAAGLFWRKSDDWMVLFISTVVMMSPIVDMPLPYTLAMRQPIWQWVHTMAHFLAVSSWFTWPLVFPTGRFVPRWTRWKIFFDIAFAVMGTLLESSILRKPPGWRDFVYIYVVLSICTNVFALSYRYFRVAGPVERQQIKWVFVGLMGFISVAFVSLQFDFQLISQAGSMDPVRALILSAIPDTLYRAIALFVPVSIAISVLRYRLWDIDIIISRTLVYSTLTAIIAGFYVLVVGSFSGLLQNQFDLAAPLVALLMVAVFIQPLRRALQDQVNRLLRFDPARRSESENELQIPSEQSDEAQRERVQIHVTTEPDSSPHTHLHGRWLLIARLAWIAIAILTTIVHLVALPVAFNLLRTPCYQAPCDTPFQIPSETMSPLQEEASLVEAWQGTTWEVMIWLVTLGVALLIFWHRSDDWMALLASIMLLTIVVPLSPWPEMLAAAQPWWYWPRALLWAIGLASSVGLFFLFPDGRFVPQWTRMLAIALLVIIGVLTVKGAPFLAGFPIFVIVLITGTVFQIFRYRHVSDPVQRQQTKWVVLGIIGMVLPMLVVLFVAFLNPSLNPLLGPGPSSVQADSFFSMLVTGGLIIPLCFLPVTLAFSILRYRLWDVDFVINRALVYGVLTASVVGLYVLIVGWSSIGLQTQNNLAGSVFAILVIAFLFRPLRQRLQRIADRFVPVPQTALPMEQHKHQTAIPESQSAADTRLRGRWLLIARLAWVTVFTVLGMMYALGFVEVRKALSTVCEEELCSLDLQIQHSGVRERIMNFQGPPIGFADRLRPPQVEALETLGLTLDQYGRLGALQLGIPALIFLLIAAGLFWRKSDNWMALFVSIMVATTPLWATPLPFTLAVRQPVWAPAVGVAFFISQSSNLTLPLIFPTGRFVPRWTRWVLLVALVHAAFWSFYRPLVDHPRADEFIATTILIIAGLSLYALFYRYFRVASPLERQQLKWILVGNAGFLLIAILVVLPLNELLTSQGVSMDPARTLVLSAILDTMSLATTFSFPVGIVIAVLRYRLWDVDILINRTLVYGALTGIIVIGFVVMVGLLGTLFQSSGNSIIAIIATGLVALMFNPLRQRLQRGVNHLMYGERDEPYIALSRLGRRLESTLAPEAVLPTVVTTVRDALKLPYTAIYLKGQDNEYKIIAESAAPTLRMENGKIRVPGIEREGQCIPLIHQGETLGYLVLGPRTPNEAFTSSDLRLVDDLAPQVGVAAHAIRLTADLQRSREQLVLTREEERRRLRRDLHDSLGPNLASQGLKLAAVKQLLASNPSAAIPLLDQVMAQNQSTVEDVRRLVYDLRPPALDELGLVAAIRDHAVGMDGKSTLQIEITEPAGGLPALSAAIEVAAYRIVLEALTNVIRHAQAKYCAVRFSALHNGSNDMLQIDIQDDGIGFPASHRIGIGTRSMRERAEEVGGSCVIESTSSGGTCVRAQLPILNESKPNMLM